VRIVVRSQLRHRTLLSRMRKGLHRLCFVLLLVSTAGMITALFAQSGTQYGFVFLPFRDNSGFEGKWDVGNGVPRFLAAYVKERFRLPTVSSMITRNYLQETGRSEGGLDDVRFWVDLYNRFRIRYLVAGSVDVFDVSRFMTGQPLLGGYEAFKGEVLITFRLYDLERTAQSVTAVEVNRGEAAGDFSDRSLALTLFGKPTERTMEFRELDRIAFGSEGFNQTIMGQAMFRLGENFSLELERILPSIRAWAATSPDSLLAYVQGLDTLSLSLRTETISGVVVFVEGENAFINLGTEDRLRVGQKVKVYKEGSTSEQSSDLVGELEVSELRGPHLSLTKVLRGHGSIKSRDKVYVTVTR